MTGRRVLQVAAGLVALGTATVVVANCGVVRRADGLVYSAVDEVPRRTWAIVPGAMVHSDGEPSVVLVDRVDAARALYAAGRVDSIFVSGDARDHDEDGTMARWLVAHGVPADRVVRDGEGYRTRSTMENARRAGITDAVVCTQAFHVPRAVAWARHVGIDVVGLEADQRWGGHHLGARIRETFARTLAAFELGLD